VDPDLEALLKRYQRYVHIVLLAIAMTALLAVSVATS